MVQKRPTAMKANPRGRVPMLYMKRQHLDYFFPPTIPMTDKRKRKQAKINKMIGPEVRSAASRIVSSPDLATKYEANPIPIKEMKSMKYEIN